MSVQTGNIIKNLGEEHNIVVTPLSGDELLKSTVAPNSIIVSTKINNANNADLDERAIFISDADGNVGRISYVCKPGSGLIMDGDVMKMTLDNYSIDTNENNALCINFDNILDWTTIKMVNKTGVDGQFMKVITENLDKATTTSYGVIKIDNSTLVTDNNGVVNVNTKELDYADDSSKTNGIIKISTDENPSISITNGMLSVNTCNLQVASKDNLGVIKPDNTYLFTDNNGTLTVKNFTYANVTTKIVDDKVLRFYDRGICAPDGITLTTSYGIMSVNTDGLTHASEKKFGIVKPDGVSLVIDPITSYLSVNNFSTLSIILNEYQNTINELKNDIKKLDERVSKLETPTIIDAISLVIDKTIDTLEEPEVGVKDNKNVVLCIQASIVTNCQYKITINFGNNKSPQITLDHISYRGKNIRGNDVGSTTFETTSNTKEIVSLYFNCQNFVGALNAGNCFTNIDITLSSINNSNVTTGRTFSLLRYNLVNYVTDINGILFDPFVSNELVYESDGIKELIFFDNNDDTLSINDNVKVNKLTTNSFLLKATAADVVSLSNVANISKIVDTSKITENLTHFNELAQTIKSKEIVSDDLLADFIYTNALLYKDNPSFAKTNIVTTKELELAYNTADLDEFKTTCQSVISSGRKNAKTSAGAVSTSNVLDITPTLITEDKKQIDIDLTVANNVFDNDKVNELVKELYIDDSIIGNKKVNELLKELNVANNVFDNNKVNELVKELYTNTNTFNNDKLNELVKELYADNDITVASKTDNSLDIKLVDEFPANYVIKLRTDKSYAGYLKVDITYTYTYTTYNPNNVESPYEYVTCVSNPFIALNCVSKDSNGFNKIQIEDISKMPVNISYRDAKIILSSFGDINSGNTITKETKVINYRETKLLPEIDFTVRTSIFSELSEFGTYGTISLIKTDNALSYFTGKNNLSNVCYVDFTYYYADVYGLEIPNTAQPGRIELNNDETTKVLPLNITKIPTDNAIKTVKVKDIQITPFDTTVNIQNYSDGQWARKASSIETNKYYFNDAYVSDIRAIYNEVKLDSSSTANTSLSFSITIKPGVKTNIANGTSVTLPSVPTYSNPKLILIDSNNNQMDCDNLFNEHYVINGTWSSTDGLCITMKYNNLKDKNTNLNIKYIKFNIELEEQASANKFVVKQQGLSDKIGNGNIVKLSDGFSASTQLINDLYEIAKTNVKEVSQAITTQDQMSKTIKELEKKLNEQEKQNKELSNNLKQLKQNL